MLPTPAELFGFLDRMPLADLRLGKQDGITAEAFYSCCADSIQQQEDGGRPDLFALDKDAQRNPPTHRLIRVELLSWAAQPPGTVPSFAEPESSWLSDGALDVLAHLWQYSKSRGTWTQKVYEPRACHDRFGVTGTSTRSCIVTAISSCRLRSLAGDDGVDEASYLVVPCYMFCCADLSCPPGTRQEEPGQQAQDCMLAVSEARCWWPHHLHHLVLLFSG